jgi:superfamily II DNA or RNA helicase
VYLTATLRGDGKEVDATLVYRCDTQTAIEKSFIKSVCYCPVPVSSATIQGKNFSESWSGEDIAQRSQELCRVVKGSLDCVRVTMSFVMKKLREMRASGVKHQVIVQAKDIYAATGIVAMWRQHPENIEPFVIDSVSSDLSIKQNRIVLAKLKKGDIIVHVGMIGEGFDHCFTFWYSFEALNRPCFGS